MVPLLERTPMAQLLSAQQLRVGITERRHLVTTPALRGMRDGVVGWFIYAGTPIKTAKLLERELQFLDMEIGD